MSIHLMQDNTYVGETVYMTVCSKDRDASRYPNPNSYTIDIDNDLKNIRSIELYSAILPNVNSILSEPYLLLNIDEISGTFSSPNQHISDCFSILAMSSATAGNFVHIKSNHYANIQKTYYGAPKAKLNKMSISFKKEDGTLFSFGTDTDPPTKNLQHTLTFKVTTLHTDKNVLNVRNLY